MLCQADIHESLIHQDSYCIITRDANEREIRLKPY